MTAGAEPRGERFSYAEAERFADGRIFNPVCLRNNPPMVARLALVLNGRTGPVLEIGAGTGQHAAAFALAFPQLDWWPSDPDPDLRASIDAWQAALRAPVRPALDVNAATDWGRAAATKALGPLVAVLSMNVVHTAPFAVTEGIVRGAAAALRPNGLLLFYGPFHIGGRPTGPGNAAFDRDLRARNPNWGIRDIEEIAAFARPMGFQDPVVYQMPSDNRLLSLTFTP